MLHIKSRRARIRVFSYVSAGLFVSAGLAVTGFVMAYKLRMSVEYSYQRSLSELSEHVDNIDLALQKGYYASTSAQLVGLSAQIWSDSGAAKADLAQMPLSTVNLDNTNRFITQVGDYANTLGRQLSTNQKITSDDRGKIKSLSTSAKKLSGELSSLTSKLQSGRLTLFKSESILNTSNIKQASTQTTLEDGFKNIETSFSGLPSMIYDGPFSDNVQKKQPVFTQGKAQVTREQARSAAAGFLKVDAAALKDAGETAGNLPTFNFSTGDVNIYVTKAGGYVARMLSSRASSSASLDANASLAKAAAFLQGRGITSMTATYTLLSNNVCNINFAFVQNGVVCYPDLIKLGVAQDTGDILSFDATGYLMNHTVRKFPAVKQTKARILSLLNPKLTAKKVTLTLIPTDSGGEALCYEVKCLGENNQNVIDYFDAATGVEQKLLIITETPGGSLPM